MGLVIFFSFIIFYPLTRLLLAYRRLRPVQQIRMTRVATTHLSVTQLQAAQQTITHYLQNYALDDEVLKKQWENMGLSATTQQDLQKQQQHLLEDVPVTTKAWLKDFEQDFIQPLDAVVEKRIEYHAKRLALKTALSPNALLDMAVVLHSGFSLLREICALYQVRVGYLGTVYLLGLIIFQSYTAGQVQQNMAGAEHLLEGLMEGTLGVAGAKLTSIVSVKAGEAALHYFFMRRIGQSMKLQLRPLAT